MLGPGEALNWPGALMKTSLRFWQIVDKQLVAPLAAYDTGHSY